MKKNNFFLMRIMMIILILISCSEDEKPSLSHEENIIGVWQESARTKNGEDDFYCSDILSFNLTTFKWEEYYDSGCLLFDSDNHSEPYTIDGDALTVEDSGETYVFKILSLDAGNMELEYSFNGEDVLVSTYQKL